MPNQIIPNAARQMREVLVTRRAQHEMQLHDIECKLEETEDEIGRLTDLISAYDEIDRQAHGSVDPRPTEAPVKLIICYEPPEHDSPTNPTTENMTLIERVKQMVLLHPGKAVDIAARLGTSAHSISNRLTTLANMGEIAHWPEYHMWGPIEWTPPTNGGESNA